MRVLHVNRYAWRFGGAESYMLDLADLQCREGHAVEIFGMKHARNPPHALERHFPDYVDFRGESASGQQKVRGLARMMWSRSAHRGVADAISEFRPDVAHIHGIYHELSPSVLWPLAAAHVPVVMTVHDYKLVCPSQDLLAADKPCTACYAKDFWHAAQKRCRDGSFAASAALAAEAYLHDAVGSYSKVDRFLCPSRFMKEQLDAGGYAAAPKEVLNNFVATDLGPRRMPAEVGAGPYFLYAGRLTRPKGIDVAIRAVAQVPNVRLVIAGQGKDESELRRLAEESGAPVMFLGHQDRAATLGLMASATAMILPARWYENQPMSILEANSVGTPVITTRMGGLPELVTHGVDGWLVEPESVEALAAALRAATDDPDAAREMGERARRRVAKMHDAAAHVATVLRIYGELAGGERDRVTAR